MARKYYYGNNITKDGRICLGELMEPRKDVYLVVKEPDPDKIHVLPYDGNTDVPKEGLRKVDSMRRISLSPAMRGNATRALIGPSEYGGVVIWLQYN